MPGRHKDRLTALRAALVAFWGEDRVTGRPPHPDTVEAVLMGVHDAVEQSHDRPFAYADEPWREMTTEEHAKHALDHAAIMESAVTMSQVSRTAFDEDRFPHSTHAILRLMFANHRARASGAIGANGKLPFGYPNKEETK